ncbi:Methyltransferase domain-containing protein [Lachnospiraceae bacterium KH1T2]|nr:Methyltransferase domain-containing protein [Lachnospiraceae bacterium KH1T2]
MSDLEQYLSGIFAEKVQKMVISKPANKSGKYRKINIAPVNDFYQVSKYTEKQVFHDNVECREIVSKCVELMDGQFMQLNAWTDNKEFALKISKKGKLLFNEKKVSADKVKKADNSHNRQKNYILKEGEIIEPLIDMGIFTSEGKIVRTMYDKYRQINRFIEIIDDTIREKKMKSLNIIDFGCGKSYLTFIVYYYLTEVRGIDANIIGLDLKEDVIKKCNEAAKKYGYEKLRFELGDINGFKCPFDVDMVMTLHACDTATDYALFNAISWNAKMIFSVPCCQHELNKQMETENLSILTRYGIIQERFAALLTDSIRGNLLTYSGYKTQLLEFIDFAHTPKNILIRAIKKPSLPAVRKAALTEVENAIKEFNVEPTLYNLLEIKK